jgi:hypothetical protein
MGKVGRWVTDPKAGGYCKITLDSGERIVVNHDKGGFKGGRVTIERSTFLGFELRPHLCLRPRQPGWQDRPRPSDPWC